MPVLPVPPPVLALGAALGVAGALMQGVTRNPLADPGLLGVNAGAAFAVVLAIWAFDTTEVLGLVWFAFVGAAIIIASGVYTAHRERVRRAKIAVPAEPYPTS